MVSRIFDRFLPQDQREQHVSSSDRDSVNAQDEQEDAKHEPVHDALIGACVQTELRVPHKKAQDTQEQADAEEDISFPGRAQYFFLILFLHIEKSADGDAPHFPCHVHKDKKKDSGKAEQERSGRSSLESDEDHFRDLKGADNDQGDDLADHKSDREGKRQGEETEQQDLCQEHKDDPAAAYAEEKIHAKFPAPLCEHEFCRIVDKKADHKEDDDIDKIQNHLEGVHPFGQTGDRVR